MKTLFQNENWIVVEKPAGVLTVPSRYQEKDHRKVLGLQLQKEIGRQIFPVHRLDFEVSGITLWALNAKTHQMSQSWFEHRKIHKFYRALSVQQSFTHWPSHLKKADKPFAPSNRERQLWKCKISKGKRRSFESDHGLHSVTEAQVVDFNSQTQILHWDLQPLTGRSHQLRFEMSRHGFPILGDQLYGSTWPVQDQNTIALKAFKLDLSLISEKERSGLPMILQVDPRVGEFG